LGKIFARWTTHALPLLILSPMLALMLGALPGHLWPMICALALLTLATYLAGATAAALTLGSRRGFLLPLLLAPLSTPLLIFCVSLAANGFGGPAGIRAALFFGGLFLLYLCAAPPLCAAALRSAVEAS